MVVSHRETMERDRTGRDDGPGLIALLTQLSKSFNRRSTEEMLGMRLKEFLVLSYLRDHLGTTQQELGEAMLLDPNTVVLLLNELELRGYSIRRRDAEDRRRHVVDITAAGREAVARAEEARELIEDEVLGELSASDRRTLRRILLRALEGQARTPAAPTLRA
jgi:DNA-binding MarR family transcriptional regulator